MGPEVESSYCLHRLFTNHEIRWSQEKEGLQGGKGVNNEDGRPQHIHDPGIQQELPSYLERLE